MDAQGFSDLAVRENGRWRVPPTVHPMADLLERDAEGVLDGFIAAQAADVRRLAAELEGGGGALGRMLADLVARAPELAERPLFRPGGLGDLFDDLHHHVMSHPVWRHPFFVRFFAADFDRDQLHRFLVAYFNQVKNTRQCVALAQGRFHGLARLAGGPVAERLSEMTQVVLAQLLADEYGVAIHAPETEPSVAELLGATTHVGLYRRLLDALGIAPADQDVPLLPEVADNVLTQRLVAGDPAFTPLEALASVGLGMEWGVPEFFSLLLGGVIRHARDHDLALTARDLEILTGHVRFDVFHALAVTVVTGFHIGGDGDVRAVKEATNLLMAARYAMMSGLYRHVFDEACADLEPEMLHPQHKVQDDRIVAALLAARAGVPEGLVTDTQSYRTARGLPFVFAHR